MDSPLLSFIIVSWNTRAFLKQCLVSINQFAVVNHEIIVIDNGSQDDSIAMVQNEFRGVKIIANNANLGFAKANNIGIKAARGKYFCLINSDAELLPDCIPTLITYMETHDDTGMCGPLVLGKTGLPQDLPRGYPTLWNMTCFALCLGNLNRQNSFFNGYEIRNHNLNQISQAEVLSGCFWLVRAKAVEQVGGLDENFFMYGEDIDWCKRFHDCGFKIVFNPNAKTVHYGGGSSSLAPTRFFIEMQRANLQYWKKHHGSVGLVFYYLILLVHHMIRSVGWTLRTLLPKHTEHNGMAKAKRSVASLRWLALVPITGIRKHN